MSSTQSVPELPHPSPTAGWQCRGTCSFRPVDNDLLSHKILKWPEIQRGVETRGRKSSVNRCSGSVSFDEHSRLIPPLLSHSGE